MSGYDDDTNAAEFQQTMAGIVAQISGSGARSESGAKFQAHIQLQNFSCTHWENFETNESENKYIELCGRAEIASFAVLMQCASDINKPTRVLLSHYDQQLNQTDIKIAAISLNRDDIDAIDGRRTDMTLCLQDDAGTADMGQAVVQPHPDADEDVKFDLDRWMEPRLGAIRHAVSSGAEIISLSEFDFPVEVGSDEVACRAADAKVLKEMQEIIDGAGRPIFLIAGSRHEPINGDRTKGWGNFAKILASKQIKTQPQGGLQSGKLCINHAKLVSACSAGENITAPHDKAITYYETNLGVIGVLICIDAYSPNILFSLINSRRADQTMAHPDGEKMRKRLDYIIVPAYNRSRKLYYACQVLSLMCETIVVLVDGWRREEKKPAQTALFVCGRMFSDIHESDPNVGELNQHPDNPNFQIWDLSLDYIRDHRQRKFRGTPTLNEAEKLQAVLPAEASARTGY